MRYTHRLSRRTLLRGAAAGVPLALGLPALESMLDGNGEAYADGTPILRRMGVWFFGAGGHWEWTPPATGPLVLPVGLTPLERHKRNVLLISNLDWESFGDFATNRHFMGAASVLTGTPWKSNGPQGPSLDQVVAPYLNKGRRASLELSLTDTNVISWSGVASPNPPMNDPNKVFASLFGDSTGSTRSLRALYLDAIKSDAASLRTKLGAGDRTRLAGYLDGINELQTEITSLNAGSQTAACTPAAADLIGGATPDVLKKLSGNLALVNMVMSKLLATALACGQTQVFTYAFTTPNSAWGWPLMPALANNHHELGHQHHPDLPRSVDFLMQRLADTMDALAAMKEGAGTVLDNTGILVTTEVARNHENNNVPTLLVGGAGGTLRGGTHLAAPKGHRTTDAGFTLARAVGAMIPSYGASYAKVTEVLDGALV